VWHDLALTLPPDAPRSWRDVYTDAQVTATPAGTLRLADVMDRLPAALLVST
jgi:hypothetical protein